MTAPFVNHVTRKDASGWIMQGVARDGDRATRFHSGIGAAGQLWERTAELADSPRADWLPTPANVVDAAVELRVRNARIRDRGHHLPLAADHDHSRSGIYKEGRRIQ